MHAYKRCRCADGDGTALENRCPKLRRGDGSWNPAHGTWYGKADLPPAPDGKRVTLKAGGFRTETDMRDWFTRALHLIALPEAGPAGHRERAEILALIRESRKRREPLPSYDDIRWRHAHGAAYRTGTTGEYLTSWLDERARAEGDLARSTIVGYRSHIARMLPHFGDVPLAKLREHHVSAFFASVDAENARILAARASADPAVVASVRGKRITGTATKQRIRATLRSALSDAMARKLVTVNAATLVRLGSGKRPKARVWTPERVAHWRAGYEEATEGITAPRRRFAIWCRTDMRPSPVMVWTPEQTGAFLDFVAGDRLYALWHLIVFRGLRRGEACGLRWEDTSLGAKQISVMVQLVDLPGGALEERLKTDASDAAVALDTASVKVLRAWRRAQAAERLAFGQAWTDSGRVFTREDGRALSPGWVTKRFQWLAFRAGLPPVREHDARHGAASIARHAGADMKAIQEMLRHSSQAITSDTYTSVFEEASTAVAEAMTAVVPRKAAAGGSPATDGPRTVPGARPLPRRDDR